MKILRKIIAPVLLALLVVTGVAFSDYFPDVIVTSPNGIWTDTRAYTTLDAAITAIGANDRDIYIVRQEATTALTIPSNASLHFMASGSIANTGNLTLQTTSISAPNKQIFTGVGNIRFADGTILKTGWFANVESSFALTSDDTVTLIVSKPQTLTANFSPGNNVVLKWESPGNILTVAAGREVGNLKLIEAGRYQIFAGAGDFDFLDGAVLRSSWFNRLRSVTTWIESEEVKLIIDKSEEIDTNVTFSTNTSVEVEPGAIIGDDANEDLTINGPFIHPEPTQCFDWDGTGNISGLDFALAEWFGFSTSATAANNALYMADALAASRVVKIESAGTYSCDPFTISINGTTLYSDKRDHVELSYSGSTIFISLDADRCTIEGLKITGPDGAAGAGDIGIKILNQEWTNTIQNCRLEDWDKAIQDDGYNNKIINNYIANFKTYGIDILGVSSGYTEGNYIATSAGGNETGIYITSASHYASYNDIIGGTPTNGIYIESCNETVIENCHMETPTTYDIRSGDATSVVTVIGGRYQGKFRSAASPPNGTNWIFKGFTFNGTPTFNNFGSSIVTFENVRGLSLSEIDVSCKRVIWPDMEVYVLDTTDKTTTGAGEDDLNGVNLPQDLDHSYGGVKVHASGTKANGGAPNNKTLKFYFGATSYTFHAAANNTNDWSLDAEINFVSDSQHRVSYKGWDGGSGGTIVQDIDSNNASDFSAGTVNMKITGECTDAGDTIHQFMWRVELIRKGVN